MQEQYHTTLCNANDPAIKGLHFNIKFIFLLHWIYTTAKHVFQSNKYLFQIFITYAI